MTDQEAFEEWMREEISAQMTRRMALDKSERGVAEETWHAALAYLRSQDEPVGKVVVDGVCGVSFTSAYNYGCDLPVGTLLYLAPVAKVPDGWQLVPKEPLPEMLEAGTMPKGLTMDGYPVQHTLRDKYIAMLAKAPEYEEKM